MRHKSRICLLCQRWPLITTTCFSRNRLSHAGIHSKDLTSAEISFFSVHRHVGFQDGALWRTFRWRECLIRTDSTDSLHLQLKNKITRKERKNETRVNYHLQRTHGPEEQLNFALASRGKTTGGVYYFCVHYPRSPPRSILLKPKWRKNLRILALS